MLLVQFRSLTEADVELRAVAVRPIVCHGEGTCVRVRVPNLLVIEFVAINTNATSAIAFGSVSSLGHEAPDDAVEDIAFVVQLWGSFFASTNCAEVLCRQWHRLTKNFKDNATLELNGVWWSDANVKIRLNVFRIKVRHLRVNTLLLHALLVLIETPRKSESLVSSINLSSLRFIRCYGLFELLKCITRLFVVRLQIDCRFQVCCRLFEVLNLHTGHTSQIK